MLLKFYSILFIAIISLCPKAHNRTIYHSFYTATVRVYGLYPVLSFTRRADAPDPSACFH